MKRAPMGLMALAGLLAAASSDTLTLRDGTTVSGTWLGADGDQIAIMIGNHTVKYPRAMVSGVTFGEETPAPAAPSPKPPSSPPKVAAPGAGGGSGTEARPSGGTASVAPVASGATTLRPIDVVHFWDPAGPIAPIEHAAVIRVAGSAGMTASWEIKGARSTFRIKRSPAMLFLVRLEAGVNANQIHLYRLTSSGSVRRPYTMPGSSNPYRTAPLSLTGAGDSIGLAPVGELTEGEYAFIRAGSGDAYCFGIDLK